MAAQPHPGPRGIGGATPKPRAALIAAEAASTRHDGRALPALPPADALLAAFAWHANQAITGQVGFAYALAHLARSNAEALAATGRSTLPQGPARDAVTAIADAQIEAADGAARAATRFGRHFGHLAFAFPRPG